MSDQTGASRHKHLPTPARQSRVRIRVAENCIKLKLTLFVIDLDQGRQHIKILSIFHIKYEVLSAISVNLGADL